MHNISNIQSAPLVSPSRLCPIDAVGPVGGWERHAAAVEAVSEPFLAQPKRGSLPPDMVCMPRSLGKHSRSKTVSERGL